MSWRSPSPASRTPASTPRKNPFLAQSRGTPLLIMRFTDNYIMSLIVNQLWLCTREREPGVLQRKEVGYRMSRKSKSFTQTRPTWGKFIGIQCIRRLMFYRHKTTYGDSLYYLFSCAIVYTNTQLLKINGLSGVQCGAFNNITCFLCYSSNTLSSPWAVPVVRGV